MRKTREQLQKELTEVSAELHKAKQHTVEVVNWQRKVIRVNLTTANRVAEAHAVSLQKATNPDQVSLRSYLEGYRAGLRAANTRIEHELGGAQ